LHCALRVHSEQTEPTQRSYCQQQLASTRQPRFAVALPLGRARPTSSRRRQPVPRARAVHRTLLCLRLLKAFL